MDSRTGTCERQKKATIILTIADWSSSFLLRSRVLDKASPNGFREEIDTRHRDQDHYEDKAHFIPVVDTDAIGQLETDAPCPHDPQDGSQARIGFEMIQYVAQHHRQDLRQDTKPHDLQPIGTGRPDALDLPALNVLDGFGEELGEGTGIADGNCHHPSERIEANGIDEHQRPEQRIDATDTVEDTAQAEVQYRLRYANRWPCREEPPWAAIPNPIMGLMSILRRVIMSRLLRPRLMRSNDMKCPAATADSVVALLFAVTPTVSVREAKLYLWGESLSRGPLRHGPLHGKETRRPAHAFMEQR
jgi:hypothetical protein